MEERTKKVIGVVEDTLKDFMFEKYDKIEIEGLDALMALKMEEYEEIQKCEIQTKVLEEGAVKTETFVLIKWEDSDNPLTFKCMTSPVKQ